MTNSYPSRTATTLPGAGPLLAAGLPARAALGHRRTRASAGEQYDVGTEADLFTTQRLAGFGGG